MVIHRHARDVERQVVPDDQATPIPRRGQEHVVDELRARHQRQPMNRGVLLEKRKLIVGQRVRLIKEPGRHQPYCPSQLKSPHAQGLAGVKRRFGIERQRPRRRADICECAAAWF